MRSIRIPKQARFPPGWQNALTRLGVAVLAVLLAILPSGSIASGQAAVSGLVLLLGSDRAAYGAGAVATLVLAVDNPTDAPITATFSSAQVYDIVAYDGQAEVWRAAAGQAFAAALTDRTYAPGVTLLGRERWDFRDTNGAPVPPGRYRIIGTLMTAPPQSGSPVEITLTP